MQNTVIQTGPFSPLVSFFRDRRLIFPATLLIVVFSRIPFLDAGYGTHGDTRLVITAARSIALIGHYTISRVPGYPLQEYLYSLVWRGGPAICNGISACMCGIAAAFFSLIARDLKCRYPVLLGVVLAFVPVIYISSVSSIDFTWGLAFSMASFYAILHRHALPSAILLGCAIGTRLTWGALIIPFSIVLFDAARHGAVRRLFLGFVGPALATGCLFYFQSWSIYGLSFINYEPYEFSTESAIKSLTTDIWGVIGTLTIASACASGMRQLLWNRPGETRPALLPGQLRSAGIAIILIYLFAFFIMPLKGAYLIPTIPVVIIILSRTLRRRALIITCILLCISPFFISLTRSFIPLPESPCAFTISPGGKPTTIDIARGPVFLDHARRSRAMETVAEILLMCDSLRRPAVVGAGWNWLPYFRAGIMNTVDTAGLNEAFSHDCVRLFKPFRIGRVEFKNILSTDELIRDTSMHIPVYVMPNQPLENIRWNGTDPRNFGAKLLRIHH
jgi:hypothetical protein